MIIWMTIWIVTLAVGVFGFALLLLMVSSGAIRELKETLQELREDRREADEHPKSLDEAI